MIYDPWGAPTESGAGALYVSARNTRQRGDSADDTLKDILEVGDDITLGDAQDMSAERGEGAIPRGIEALAAAMRTAAEMPVLEPDSPRHSHSSPRVGEKRMKRARSAST